MDKDIFIEEEKKLAETICRIDEEEKQMESRLSTSYNVNDIAKGFVMQMYAKKINGKWGFVNEENKLIINNEYDMVTEFNKYGFAGIKKGGKWGVVNIKGEIIQEPIYSFKWENPSFIGKYYKTKEWEQEYYTEELPE